MILGGEYISRIIPVGSHDWKKFITPKELTKKLAIGTVYILVLISFIDVNILI